jgi:hypothetical protein
MNKNNKKLPSAIRSSAAEYLTFVAETGDDETNVEMRYEDENIWLTQKMMAELYDVSVDAINQHLKKIFSDGELAEDSDIKKYLISAADGKTYNTKHYNLHTETEFEKYRIIQDRLFESDFDKCLETMKEGGEDNDG